MDSALLFTFPKAVKYYKHAIEICQSNKLDQKEAIARCSLFKLLVRCDRDAALNEAEKAVQADPNYVEVSQQNDNDDVYSTLI